MKTFSALLALCEGNSPVTCEFPLQRPVTWSFDLFFDLRLNKRLSKPSRRRCFGAPSHTLWRHCNVMAKGRKEQEQVILDCFGLSTKRVDNFTDLCEVIRHCYDESTLEHLADGLDSSRNGRIKLNFQRHDRVMIKWLIFVSYSLWIFCC